MGNYLTLEPEKHKRFTWWLGALHELLSCDVGPSNNKAKSIPDEHRKFFSPRRFHGERLATLLDLRCVSACIIPTHATSIKRILHQGP